MTGSGAVAGLSGLDHIFFVVGDLAAGAAALAGMGFVVEPEGQHDAGLGTANRLVMFAADYLELITPRGESPIGTLLRRDLQARGNHCGALVIATADMDATIADLTARGFAVPTPIRYSREVDCDGRRGTARFVTAQVPAFERYGVRLLLIQHLTPELLFPVPPPRHGNGGTEIARVDLAVGDRDAAISDFTRLLGAGQDGQLAIGRARIVLTAMEARPLPFGAHEAADQGVTAVAIRTAVGKAPSHGAPEIAAATRLILDSSPVRQAPGLRSGWR